MRLEDLRGFQVADVALQVSGSDTLFPCAFHHHAEQAAWHTINAILKLGGESQDGRVDERIGVVEWWRTLETLISLLHLISEEERNERASIRLTDKRPTDDIIAKWSWVTRWFSDRRQPLPSRLTGLVQDLRDFRNSFEHNSRTRERPRSHSRLASKPADANLADLMEAVAICVATIQWIRYLLPSVDLMPSVWTPTAHDDVVFERLDVLAKECWFPAFQSALKGRGLTSDVAPYDDHGSTIGSALWDARVLIRYEDERPLPPSSGDGAIRTQVIQWGAERPRQPSEDTFLYPDYARA
jgi:hypothetical protein